MPVTENPDAATQVQGDRCLGPAQCYPGVGAQVSRLPGSLRDALDWNWPFFFHGDLPALAVAGPLRRFVAYLGWEASNAIKSQVLQIGDQTMHHPVVTRKEWLAARLALLKEEKELTRRSDELARRRQELPWVLVDKAYRFETDEGSASLADLFRGRAQLLVYHFMFGPDYSAGRPSCSSIADGFNGIAAHLANHDVMLWTVSRAR